MKLLIDTVNEDLFMSIISEDTTLSYAHLKTYKNKSDILPFVFKKIVDKANIETSDIKEIFIVNGPGSFMGIRAGLVFGKTMALMTGAKLFSINNLKFISGGIDGEYFVDSKGKKSYKGTYKNKEINIEISDFKNNSIINYENIIQTPFIYLELFEEVVDIPSYEATYFKEPQIGGV